MAFGGGAEVVQRWCGGGAEVVRRWCRGGAEVVQRWCRGGAEVVQRWCRGGAEVAYLHQHFRWVQNANDANPDLLRPQGTRIDRIEYHVEHAVDYVLTGADTTRDAHIGTCNRVSG
ncbi:unnamed protein product [Darwinula stevensoni]|uniref:Uncharacterized protein n=1 Tax=Darwinula stevensoni TaxID=69355 RepID=A0A7R9FQT9_9CRUS|nr:unnamed protein product [Darwinula stevensoni]CAG0899765.1 unnamed protein product [Darwinula stevensoni]